MSDFFCVNTERLTLTRPALGDFDDVHELHADPGVWEHYSSLRHTDRAQTKTYLQRQQRGWDEDGLAIWVARRSAPDGHGPLIGVGGCTVRSGVAWNLGYRLARHAWGHGYAQEIIAEARTRQHNCVPSYPSWHTSSNTTPAPSGRPSVPVCISSGVASTSAIPTRPPCCWCTPTDHSTRWN